MAYGTVQLVPLVDVDMHDPRIPVDRVRSGRSHTRAPSRPCRPGPRRRTPSSEMPLRPEHPVRQRRLIERPHAGHPHRTVERRPAVGRAHDHHRVVLRRVLEAPPRQVDVTVDRVDRNLRVLHAARAGAQRFRRAPRHAAVQSTARTGSPTARSRPDPVNAE